MTMRGKPKKGSAAIRCDEALRKLALAYPGATEDHPWGHSAYKVRGKAFVFVGLDEDGIGLSAKLPHSNREALLLPFAAPTRYGLGKSGWVSASFGPDEVPPLGVLSAWIEESYRAIAPKKLVAELDAAGGAAAAPAPGKRKAPAKKKAAKKATKKKATKKKASKKKASKKKAGKKKAGKRSRA